MSNRRDQKVLKETVRAVTYEYKGIKLKKKTQLSEGLCDNQIAGLDFQKENNDEILLQSC